MKPVILSADGEAMLYSVPDAVAEHLEDCCMAFCTRWLWESPPDRQRRHRRVLHRDGLYRLPEYPCLPRPALPPDRGAKMSLL